MAITFGKYVLKKPVMTDNRIKKVIKSILFDYQEDRNKALEGYEMFLEKIEQNQTQNVDVVRGMVECLRLAQSASTNQLKIVDICIKLNVIMRGQESKLKDLNSEKG